VPALQEALGDADPAVQFAALKSLASVGPAAKSALPAIKRTAIKAGNPSVRSGAVTVLARLGSEGETAIVELLGGDDSATRLACLQQLGRKGKAPKTAVPNLVKALTDRDADVRVLAAHVLGLLGAEAKPAVPALTKALEDRDANVRAIAAKALAKIKGE
jgi:HEAT repeat protein